MNPKPIPKLIPGPQPPGWAAHPILRFLAASARHGSALLAAGVFVGVLVPPVAHAMRGVVAPAIVMLMTLVLLRVDVAGTLAHLRRPGRVLYLVLFQALACPLVAWAVARPLGLDPTVVDGVVIFATGCAATSSPAFARMVGLDPELSLVVTLATTFLVPLLAPPMALALLGVDLALSVPAFMGRLALVVVLPLLLSLGLRRAMGPPVLERVGPAVDGALVWLVVLYGVAVMDGLTARALAEPGWVAQALAAAFVADYGLNGVTVFAASWMGRRAALTAGLMSGNRNMALYLAVLPAAADPKVALFFGLCQFPLFLSPFLLRPLYRRLLRPPAGLPGSAIP